MQPQGASQSHLPLEGTGGMGVTRVTIPLDLVREDSVPPRWSRLAIQT